MYQHGKRTKRPRNSKVIAQAALLLGVSLIAVAFILQKDLRSGTTEKTTVPIVTEVEEDKKDIIVINEPLFTMEMPADWKQTNRVQGNAANYYEFRSTKKGADDRRLLVHIDVMPPSYKVVQLQPLIVDGNTLRLGNLSSNCVNFARGATEQKTQGNGPVEAKWENISFVCDPITANQTIGTGTAENGIAARLSGSSGEHSFFFYYEDHNIRPDSKIFQDMLKSFKAR